MRPMPPPMYMMFLLEARIRPNASGDKSWLASAAEFESATLGLEIRCSVRLSYAPVDGGPTES